MICFVGDSHAPRTLAAAAVCNGFEVTDDPAKADLVFISEDTPTNEAGERNLAPIRQLVWDTMPRTMAPVVLTSQVPPGFTRGLDIPGLICMAETLRIKDAMKRARSPEQFIFGVADPQNYALPISLADYAFSHAGAKVLVMSYEEAEFSKIAINMFLAAQVDATNRLSAAAAKVGARWPAIVDVLQCDRRIGPHAYLEPGRWQDSAHLLRDSVTLEAILAR